MEDKVQDLLNRKAALERSNQELMEPGSWDWNSDASFTRNYFFLCNCEEIAEIKKELCALGVKVE